MAITKLPALSSQLDRAPMQQTIPVLDRVARERERLNALHDAIAIVVAEIGQNDLSLRDAIVRRLRAAERNVAAENPPDERGMKHPWPVELSSLCDSIQYFERKPLDVSSPEIVTSLKRSNSAA